MTRHSEESEKAVEAYLSRRVKELGGLCLKFSSATQTGYPDRIVHLPGGVAAWVELKSKGKSPTRLQLTRIDSIRRMGIPVAVCDSRETVDAFLTELQGGGL